MFLLYFNLSCTVLQYNQICWSGQDLEFSFDLSDDVSLIIHVKIIKYVTFLHVQMCQIMWLNSCD